MRLWRLPPSAKARYEGMDSRAYGRGVFKLDADRPKVRRTFEKRRTTVLEGLDCGLLPVHTHIVGCSPYIRALRLRGMMQRVLQALAQLRDHDSPGWGTYSEDWSMRQQQRIDDSAPGEDAGPRRQPQFPGKRKGPIGRYPLG